MKPGSKLYNSMSHNHCLTHSDDSNQHKKKKAKDTSVAVTSNTTAVNDSNRVQDLHEELQII